jgi:hypothetical protein
MADLGGGTRGTFTLGMPYQCTVAKASSRVPRSPLGGADGGIKDAWFLVVCDAANGFDCERSGSVRDRGPPPALLCKRSNVLSIHRSKLPSVWLPLTLLI